jgi:hypothetical protein
MPVFLVTVFSKSQKVNLTKAERNALKSITVQIIESYSKHLVHFDPGEKR